MSPLGSLSLIRTPDGVRPYGIVLPRPTPSGFLAYVARNAANVPELHRAHIHFMAVADSGVPLATAIIMERSRRGDRHREDLLSIIEPGRPEHLPHDLDSAMSHVIVDNSVKSMATINMVYHRLQSARVTGSVLLKLIDYEDQTEYQQQQIIERELRLRVISLFRLSDVLGELPDTGDAVLRSLLYPLSREA